MHVPAQLRPAWHRGRDRVHSTPEAVGAGAWCGVQLLGGLGGAVCPGSPLPAGDASAALHAVALQAHVAGDGVHATAGSRPLTGPCARHGDRNRAGRDRDSLDLRRCPVPQEGRGQMEIADRPHAQYWRAVEQGDEADEPVRSLSPVLALINRG